MLEYLHPSVSSVIIDNSTVFTTAQGQTLLFAAFPAPSGPDNQLQLVTSDSMFNFYYGLPNISVHGQAAYNVVNWVNAGGAALCFRILPYLSNDGNGNALQPSTYALQIVEVGTATTVVNGQSNKTIKVRTKVLGDGKGPIPQGNEVLIRDDATIVAEILATPQAAEEDGFTWYPIFALRTVGRGKYGNSYGITLELTSTYDNTYPQRLYQLTIFSAPSQVVESFTVAMYPEAVDSSGAAQDITNVLLNYSGVLRCDFSDANYEAVATFINPNTELQEQIDIFTLEERAILPAPTIHAGCSVAPGSANLIPSDGSSILLGGGTDGDWLGPNSQESLLYDAYSGSGDFVDPTTGFNIYDTHFSDIWNTLLYPVDVILDGNYPFSVKVAMANFASTRGDLVALLDVGFTGSPAQALTIRSTQLAINTFYAAIWAQDFTVYDPNTGSQIRVTPTYFIASLIPTVDNAFGLQYPFVGPRRGTLAGFTSISWIPDPTYMESLYLAQVNYAETNTKQTALMSQTTSQLSNSALSDLSHVRVLLRIRRNLTNIAQNFRFEFNDKTTWAQLQYSCQQELSNWIANRALTSGTAQVYASSYDVLQRIVRVTASIVFNGLIERVAISIIVNS